MEFFTCNYIVSDSNNFTDNILFLLKNLKQKNRIFNLVFFCSCELEDYNSRLQELKSLVALHFEKYPPLLNFVVQPLEKATQTGVEVYYLSENIPTSALCYKLSGNTSYLSIETNEQRILVLEGVISNSVFESITIQSEKIFQNIEQIFEIENMPIHNIVRQWNYIGNITSVSNDVQHYQAFNDARTRFYGKTRWSNGYPAATGISMSVDAVIVSLIAISNTSTLKIYPVDNTLQLAAHKYTASVLIGDETKTTPKFERGKLISDATSSSFFVSGTAAIRGEQSMNELNASLQTIQTIENIQYLISTENLRLNHVSENIKLKMKFLRVYVKYLTDFDAVKKEVDKVWSELPVIYLLAGICRSELLVEIEGMAVSTF